MAAHMACRSYRLYHKIHPLAFRCTLRRRCLSLLRQTTWHRHCSTLAAPNPSTTKIYPEKVQRLADEICKLTLLETSELNELLKKTLNIQDMQMAPMAMMTAPAEAAPEEEEKEEEQTEFEVKLTAFDPATKIKLIKEIKNVVPGLNLVQAKKFVEAVPQVLKEKASKEEVEEIRKVLEAVGGTVTAE